MIFRISWNVSCYIIADISPRTFRSQTLSSASAILHRTGAFVARVTNPGMRRRLPLLLLALFALLVATKLVRILPHFDGWAKLQTYTRVDFWIESSECTVRTGTILTYCMPDGTVIPIEDKSLADDRGHTLIANVYALITGRAIDHRALTITNALINALGLLSVAASLIAIGRPGAALVVLLFGYRLVVPGPVPSADATAAYVGAFSFALAGVILLAAVPLESGGSTRKHFFAMLVLATALLATATLLRQPFGIGGFLIAGAVLVARLVYERKFASTGRMRRVAALAAGLVFATFFSTHALIGLRSALYGIPRGEHVIQHGISHNLYMGLGVPGNPWGIKWSDEEGHAHASKIGPVRYASSAHYDNLWYLYLQIALNHPLQVMKIYVDKLSETLLVISDNRHGRLARVALLITVLLTAYMLLRRQGAAQDNMIVFSVWGMFGIVVLQGVLALPMVTFISPGPFAGACGLAVLIAAVTRRVLRRLHGRAPAAAA